jgi:ABC-2 type transport system permease protein
MDQKFLALYKKELKIFFALPIAYVVIMVYMVLSGIFFTSIINYYSQMSMRAMQSYYRGAELSMIDGIFRPYFQNMAVILLFIVPIITMRVFAEEKREGTSELLFTYPVSDLTIVMAKFLSAFTILFIMIFGGGLSFIILRFTGDFELLPLLCGFLGLIMVGSAIMMLGIFISTLTESQMVAAVISFGLSLFLWVISWQAGALGPIGQKILTNLSIIEHLGSFSKGMIDTSDLIYYLNFTALFLFLSLRVLESKQWRG